MQPYPRALDLVWPGQLHGTGCLTARAVDTGFPTVVWRLCLGPGCGLVWVQVTPPVLAGVLGGCVWVRFVASSLFCRLGFVVFVVQLRFRLSYGTCVVACALRLHPAVFGSGVRSGRACWGLGFGCVPPLLGGCWGVCVLVRPSRVVSCSSWLGVLCGGACLCARPACSPPSPAGVCCVGVCAGPGSRLCPALLGRVVGVCFCFCVSCFGFVMSVARCPCPGPCGPCPPIPSLSGWVAGSLFFSAWRVSVRFVCPFFWWAAVPGLVLPVSAGWPLCAPFGGPVFGTFWVGGLAASCGVGGRFGGCGPFSCPPPSPPVFVFFLAGGLPVPPSAFPGLAHALARIQCGLLGCCWRLRSAWPCPGPMGRVGCMYTLGSAPSPAGLGPGSAGWAAAPGGFVWLWVRGLGLSVSFLLRSAGFNLLGGPPPLLPGARWPRV